MSHVQHCHDSKLDRDVIIKSLAPGVDQARLLDEIKALQTIRSGYVVQIYEVIRDTAGTIEAIVEEYCAGSDLSDQAGDVDDEEFVRIGYQFATGLCEIHGAEVIHRDIKPHNVRVDALGNLTIIDFGLARMAGSDAKTLSVIGTSGFMAPELFEEDEDGLIEFSSAADIFAFGSSMFFLADGSLPASIRKRPPVMASLGVDFRDCDIDIDEALADELNRCFEEDPDDRPTAEELREAFRRVLVFDKHRALLNLNGSPKYLDAENRTVTASIPGLASLVIEYDGEQFLAKQVEGDLYVNNMKIGVGHVFPFACVIAFGGPDLGAARVYVTFDVSHPGVEL